MSVNGAALEGGPAIPGPTANPEVIALLDDLMVRARSGQIQGLAAIAVVGPGVVTALHASGFVMELYVGAGVLQKRLLETMTNPVKAGSGLVLPANVRRG